MPWSYFFSGKFGYSESYYTTKNDVYFECGVLFIYKGLHLCVIHYKQCQIFSWYTFKCQGLWSIKNAVLCLAGVSEDKTALYFFVLILTNLFINPKTCYCHNSLAYIHMMRVFLILLNGYLMMSLGPGQFPMTQTSGF